MLLWSLGRGGFTVITWLNPVAISRNKIAVIKYDLVMFRDILS
jgi:hypothetical protein